MGRNVRKALAPNTLNMFPKLKLAPMRMYLMMLAKTFRPSLYALLYVTGFDLPLEELKRFRQRGSRTPGHPEYGKTPGV